MTSPRIVQAAKRRDRDSSTTASREVLLESLRICAEIAGDVSMPPSARQRALGTVGGLTDRLDEIDRKARTESVVVGGFAWGKSRPVAS
jgi:hypothetical protein